MTEPRELDVRTPDVQLRALEWGAADAPIALCLHGFPDTAQAALGYYRAAFSAGKPPRRYTELQRHWIKAELVRPTLYLHGADDGCMTVKLADRVPAVLPEQRLRRDRACRAFPTTRAARSRRQPNP